MGERKLCDTTFTVHVTSTEQGSPHCVDVEGEDTIGDVTGKAAKELEVGAGDITLHHEGVALGDLEEKVTGTTLGEGSEVEARPSKKVVARRALGDMGLGCSANDLVAVVTGEGEDSWKAMVSQMVLDADEGLDGCKHVIGDATYEAAYLGLLETVKVLLLHGADNREAEGGRTSLYAASRNGHLSVVEHLVSHGADIDKVDDFHHRTPLHLASMGGHTDVVKALLGAGANKDKQDVWGMLGRVVSFGGTLEMFFTQIGRLFTGLRGMATLMLRESC